MEAYRASKTIARAVNRDGWVCLDCSRRLRTTNNSRPSNEAISRSFRTSAHAKWAYHGTQRPFSTFKSALDSVRRAPKLPETPARTRFAPSPTGYLHIGGLRTALFSYLLAKRTGGQFLLRIEDTDQKRLVPDAEKRLYEDLQWAGLQWDEGPQVGGPHGPYKQSERREIYQKHAHELLEGGAAYRCFCTPQKSGQAQIAYVTSGCYQDCALLPPEQSLDRAEEKRESFTVRLKLPADRKKREYRDLVYGKIIPLRRSTATGASEDPDSAVDAADTILLKSDGTPTYHFANVVDDHLMNITHVIRGTEWMASTPLHYDLYRAFGWSPPEFAHVGLLVDENKAKLSKRNTDLAMDVCSMREENGVLPESLINYLALLGWSNPLPNDLYTMDGLIKNFDLKFTKGNTMARTEKLWYLQKQHVARLCDEVRQTGKKESLAPVAAQMSWVILARWPAILQSERFKTGLDLLYFCVDVLLADSKSYQNPKQYVERNRYLIEFDPSQVPRLGLDERSETVQTIVKDLLVSDFQRPTAHQRDTAVSDERDISLWFDDISARIHDGIQHQVLETTMTDALAQQMTTREGRSPFTNEVLGSIATVKDSPALSIDENQATPNLQKVWTAAVMRYLRGNLSYGLPGPSIGTVMALLGYKECCRRLGVKAEDGKGW
ncbi:Glutamate--tRNA ligase mitochondrial [Friedmanniomyces endolithicus]|uniref:Glutamate--tRNA ligase, mitochondrial n=1 Tax=Friedmanniomyces endolithicus TaxID=329885 RepID=A0AAN6QSG8_9PEZI|nr:Glutamate--tRNA ligase mitochondrial [Friedmanniomyces endolithicus]KAK0768867.1 Glutamate--tRNA ligase mitochondrial [Friedmanniomyces endolithicus]KAK0792292.1 Glutamate--tRNA ligase mitochondrial [Friedmanniomyces endolithicus]KAK0846385.1 Glutamate--tRNA ligase mitochondrial [Friedmanniomyces endolithicus]KAK0883949.1 Glutamate--tRNA ligase mitochondrial [Friedmanniomyces endolithicus]